MIVKLHGTSGSGKSTIAKNIMKVGQCWTIATPKIEAYKVEIQDLDKPVYILGKYDNKCGGCDNLLASEQIVLLHKYAALGHVFYEGLLASEYYGKLGKESEVYGDEHIFAFLYTPIDMCINRVKERRIEANNFKEFNESNTRARVKKIERLQYKLEHEFHRKTKVLNWERPLPDVMEIYRKHDIPE